MFSGADRAGTVGSRRRDAVTTALAIGTGAAVFLLIVGMGIGVLGEGIVEWVGFSTTGGRVLRGAVAGVVITAGLVQLGLLRLPFWRVTRLAQPIERRRVAMAGAHRRQAQVLYGFGFVLAGFG